MEIKFSNIDHDDLVECSDLFVSIFKEPPWNENWDIEDAFDRLRGYGLTEDQAWNVTLRAYRGGAYIKDHIYLQGLQEVREFVDNDGDFKTLYVGKVGIKHLDLVRSLLDEGVLKEARHVPDFIST